MVQVHAKNISRMDEVKQMRKLVADNTSIFPPMIKQNEFQKILDGLWATKKDMPPPIGTNPIEKLNHKARIFVSTIHAAKGGEEDNVILSLHQSSKVQKGIKQSVDKQDEEHRVWYLSLIHI